MTQSSERAPLGRRERRKIETRARLVTAARELLARQGADVTRINEITDEADVGFGSFYNYFDSKEAVIAAVVETVAQELGETISATTADLSDPAEVLSTAHRTIIAQAAEKPTLGWLLVRLEASHDVVSTALGPFALRDLQRGIDEGRFTIANTPAALVAMGGALLGTVRAVLRGQLGPDADVEHATAMLQIAGLSAADAREVASRPLRPVDVSADPLGDGAGEDPTRDAGPVA